MKRKSGGIRPSRSQIEAEDQAAWTVAALVVVAVAVEVVEVEVVGGEEEGIVMIDQEVGIEIVDETEMKIEGNEESEVDRPTEAAIAGETDGSEAEAGHLIGAEIEKIEIEMIVGGPAVGAPAIAQIVEGLVGLRVLVAAAVGGAGVETEIGTETGTEVPDDKREGGEWGRRIDRG